MILISLDGHNKAAQKLAKLVFFSAAALVPLCAQTSAVRQPDLNSLIHQVDERYDSLTSLYADFEETYRAEGIERTESGTLWLKRGGKMRWEYKAPQGKLFVSDGHEAYFYTVGDAEAQKSSLKQLDDLRSPLRYLLGKTKLRKEFDDLAITAAASDTVTLHGVPRGMSDRITGVDFQIAKGGEISQITIQSADGTVTEFRFSNVISNAPVKDDLFRFVTPPGVQVVESGEILQP